MELPELVNTAGVERHINMNCETKDMDCIRAYKFRLSPDKKRQEAIDDTLILSQQLYNKLLEKTINARKNNPKSKSPREP